MSSQQEAPKPAESSWWRIGAMLCWLAAVLALAYGALLVLVGVFALLFGLLSGGAGAKGSGSSAAAWWMLIQIALPFVVAVLLVVLGRWMKQRAP